MVIEPIERMSAGPGAETPEDRADPQHELLRAEWLRQVVISAERQTANPIRLFTARGQHENGHLARRRLSAELLEHFVDRRAGEHQVEDDERWAFLARSGESIRPRGGR